MGEEKDMKQKPLLAFFSILLFLSVSVAPGWADNLDGLRLQAEQGNAMAQYALGRLYETGRNVEQDPQQACSWFRLAALQGERLAQSALGACYETGKGVPYRDYTEAFRWYSLADMQGDELAHARLIKFYKEGLGVPQNFARVAELHRDEAEKGDTFSQYELGVMYARGRGVPQDPFQAYLWLRRADTNLPEWLEELKPKIIEWRVKAALRLTPDQLHEAEVLTARWQPKK